MVLKDWILVDRDLPNRIFNGMQTLGDLIEVSTTDGIPTVEVSTPNIMSLSRAIQIGKRLEEIANAPVQFKELHSDSVIYLVFAQRTVEYRTFQFESYGTPLAQWSARVLELPVAEIDHWLEQHHG